MLSLSEFAETVITPAMLKLADLPDTPQGRSDLDTLVASMIAEDRGEA